MAGLTASSKSDSSIGAERKTKTGRDEIPGELGRIAWTRETDVRSSVAFWPGTPLGGSGSGAQSAPSAAEKVSHGISAGCVRQLAMV
jgi:hypothetical protein